MKQCYTTHQIQNASKNMRFSALLKNYVLLKLYRYLKVKVTLEPAIRTQRGSTGIALFFL